MNIFSKLGWIAAAALGMFVVATFAGIVSAGPLDPTAAPAPTQRTQNDLLPAWHQILSATGGCDSERFDCVMPGDVAVLDRETGLVWQRGGVTGPTNWQAALSGCLAVNTGGRRGWRLPSIEELLSIDLVLGTPIIASPFDQWSGTSLAGGSFAWVVPSSGGAPRQDSKSLSYGYRCVRGSSGFDGY